ncbi:alpha/beta hydrolase [Pigmentiphaga sp. H8]|uniref:alpha/beta hydrolase n=1 Tax=Pigmentiphaga sp. H8 TaxID=2488560 RepID=UPI000F595547|nr:alpha/beta hydrolase [Pigmentiphaga sp. H8]AZG11121.1 alpha/beta hydrolase [Pigmentiphaga sp. H8]
MLERYGFAHDGASIPAALWTPEKRPSAIVQACHGGSGHKEADAVLAIVDRLVPRGMAVLAIDGPVHGERSPDGSRDPEAARRYFRAAWRTGLGRTSMAREMTAALDHLTATRGWEGLPVGYIGVSMGTAYGIPYLASDRRVQAAAIGLWSANYAASDHLAGFAARIECPIWFTQQWDDEFFDREGTARLFDALGSRDKRLVAYPGPHRALEGERLGDAIDFLAGRLLSKARP